MSDYWNVGIVAMMVTFIGGFALVVGSMPSEFLVGTSNPNFKGISTFDYLTPEGFEDWIYYKDSLLSDGVGYIGLTWFDFNAANSTSKYNIKFLVMWTNNYEISLKRVTWEFLFLKNYSIMEFKNATYNYGYYIHKEDVITQWDSDINASQFYPVEDADWHVCVSFIDNNQTRNDISEAWDNSELRCDIRFGLSNQSMTYSAWDIIAKLLFFQAWDICGSPIINGLIALPLWSAIVYIVVRIILLFIPFLSG